MEPILQVRLTVGIARGDEAGGASRTVHDVAQVAQEDYFSLPSVYRRHPEIGRPDPGPAVLTTERLR
jgi:hypothetical protein